MRQTTAIQTPGVSLLRQLFYCNLDHAIGRMLDTYNLFLNGGVSVGSSTSSMEWDGECFKYYVRQIHCANFLWCSIGEPDSRLNSIHEKERRLLTSGRPTAIAIHNSVHELGSVFLGHQSGLLDGLFDIFLFPLFLSDTHR